jgi:Competence protein CoiA-like family
LGKPAPLVIHAARAFAACRRVLIVGGVVAADLLVVGLDLVTGREVHAGDRRTEQWYKKGHNGDHTLVCLACYEGADLLDGPRTVALVPKGRDGGVRQQHFAHPPGMTPPGGQHSPESLWHAEGKQAIREWAEAQGFTARVEAWTADGRRRSDVEVILLGGHRLAVELQRSELSDPEWIARHEDYARAGITDLWPYHSDTRVARVVFRYRHPGWRFDLGARTLGLVHAKPGPADARKSPHQAQCRAVHWPPCPADQLAITWMPLASARLAPNGIKPSVQTAAELDRLAAIAARELAAERARAEAAARSRDERNHAVVHRPSARKAEVPSDGGQLGETHEAFRWDAFSPEADPDSWCFGCDICGLELTGAMLKVSPVVHVIRTMERTKAGRPREIELRYGGAADSGRMSAA